MNKLIALLFTSTLFGAELEPWFPPLWEFQGRADYLYEPQNLIDSPAGNFDLPNSVNNASFSLNLTLWPSWNGEVELLMGSNPASDVSFSYKATRATGRYQWFDDTAGDAFALTSGVTFFTVRSSFLTATGTWFHGNFNAELNSAIGKDFWGVTRLWAYAGLGMANKGNPWWHGHAAWDITPWLVPLTLTAYVDTVYGTGSHNIIEAEPFPGYAGLNHQFVNVGASLGYKWFPWGTFFFDAFYNIHARNFPSEYYGVGATLRMPFGL